MTDSRNTANEREMILECGDPSPLASGDLSPLHVWDSLSRRVCPRGSTWVTSHPGKQSGDKPSHSPIEVKP